MANFAVTMFMSAKSGGKTFGWSESHIRMDAGTADDVVAPAIALANKRIVLFGKGPTMDAVRISDVAVNRDALLLVAGNTYNGAQLLDKDPGVNAQSSTIDRHDQPNACIKIRLLNNNARYKTLYLAGVPDNLIISEPAGAGLQFNQAWLTNFWPAYLQELCPQGSTSKWGFRARANKSENTKVEAKDIKAVGIVDNVTGYVRIAVVTTDDRANLGETVQIRGATRQNPSYKGINGQWKVAAKITDWPAAGYTGYDLRGTQGTNITNLRDLGTVELVDYRYVPYVIGDLTGQTTRKRGVGGNRPRGRSSRKRIGA